MGMGNIVSTRGSILVSNRPIPTHRLRQWVMALKLDSTNLHKWSKNYSMQYSRVVSHRSTDCTITSLTSGIGRDPVLSCVYGRS
jgi:hypothetical protein